MQKPIVVAALKYLANASEQSWPPPKERAGLVYYFTACLAATDAKGVVSKDTQAKLLATMNAARGSKGGDASVLALEAVDPKSDVSTLAGTIGGLDGAALAGKAQVPQDVADAIAESKQASAQAAALSGAKHG